MRVRDVDRVRADLRDYGFVPDRRRALRELHPPLERVIHEGRVHPGPSSLKGAA